MKIKQHSGHTQNVTNFRELLVRISLLGSIYGPRRQNLQLDTMRLQLAEVQDCMILLNLTIAAYTEAEASCRLAYRPVMGLLNRLIRRIKDSIISPDGIVKALSLAREIRKDLKRVARPAEKMLSESDRTALNQHIYATINQYLEQFIAITEQPGYTASRTDETPQRLYTMLAYLKLKSQLVPEALVNMHNAMQHRNTLLYARETGLVYVGQYARGYCKLAVNKNSEHYKPIQALSFINLAVQYRWRHPDFADLTYGALHKEDEYV